MLCTREKVEEKKTNYNMLALNKPLRLFLKVLKHLFNEHCLGISFIKEEGLELWKFKEKQNVERNASNCNNFDYIGIKRAVTLNLFIYVRLKQ